MMNSKTKFFALAMTLVSVGTLSACTSMNRNKKAQEQLNALNINKEAMQKLQGTWRTPCVLKDFNDYQSKVIRVQNDEMTEITEGFDDQGSCNQGINPVYSRVFESKFGVVGELNANLTAHVFYLNVLVTPKSGTAAVYENIEYCGISGWEDETPVDVAGLSCIDAQYPAYEQEHQYSVLLNGNSLSFASVAYSKSQ